MDLPDNMYLLPETSTTTVLMTILRSYRTSAQQFRAATDRLARLIAAQALGSQAVYQHVVETPLESTEGATHRGSQALVPILRAGQALVHSFCELLQHPEIWHLGLSRDHETLKPREYLCMAPSAISSTTHCYVLDPMLATGGSAEYAVRLLKDRGAQRVTYVGVVGAPEGVQFLHEHHPDVAIHLAALDRCLNEKGYILPGLGDFGDRYYNSNVTQL